MRQRRGVAGVVKLTEHLGIGQDLSRIPAPQLEQAAKKRRLVDAREQQDIARDRGFDQRIQDVAPPAAGLAHERGGTRVAAEADVLIEGESERTTHFCQGPVRQVQDLEPSSEALGETLFITHPSPHYSEIRRHCWT